MIKIINLLRLIKKYAIKISVVLITIYASIATYNIFVNYENYQYTHDLKEYILDKSNIELPVAKSNSHKFINAILSSSNSLNGFSESDSLVISQSTDYVHTFDKIDEFNILKELVVQNLLFNMPSEERHHFIMKHRLAEKHKIFNRFNLNRNGINIPIITNNRNPEALVFSLVVKDQPTIGDMLIDEAN